MPVIAADESTGSTSKWRSRVLAVAGALVSSAAFPPLGWWWLCPVGAALLFLSLPREIGTFPARRRTFFGFRAGWLYGAVFYLTTLWWIGHVTLPGMLALCAYLALYPAVGCAIAGWMQGKELPAESPHRRSLRALGAGVPVALAFPALEWIRSFALTGFGWNGPAVPLIDCPGVPAVSAFIGVNGFAAVAIAAGWTLSVAIRNRRSGAWVWPAAALLLMGGVLATAGIAFRITPAPAASRALLVQPNVSMEDKLSGEEEMATRRWNGLIDLSVSGLRQRPEAALVVWPESAIPWYFKAAQDARVFDPLLQLGSFTLITGSDAELWGMQNCAALLKGSSDNALLHGKVRLVPFGEYIPLRRQLPFLEWMVGDLIPLDFNPGHSLEPLQPPGQTFEVIPLICFEDTIGEHARQLIRNKPQVMVNITNDNWFHRSPAVEIHFVNSRWRASELHRPLLRSSNTGVTAVVREDGSVSDRIPAFEAGVLDAAFADRCQDITFYARHGDVVAKSCGTASLGLLIAVAWRRWHSRPRVFQPGPPAGAATEKE